jgi:hypothetical protein
LRSKEPILSLRDIADVIDSIQEFTQGMDVEAFRADSKTVAAVERKLLVISEAAVRLGDQADSLCPGLRGAISAASATGCDTSTTMWISKRSGTRFARSDLSHARTTRRMSGYGIGSSSGNRRFPFSPLYFASASPPRRRL